MEKERRIKFLGIVSLIVALLGLTIAFAALSTTLTINGTAYLDAAKWGIKFENLSEPEKVGDANTTGTAIIEEDVSINNIQVSLKTPGDSVVYNVDLVNNGTINAKIEKIEKVKLTAEQERYLNFIVKDEDEKELLEGDILSAGERKKLKIMIEYKKDITKEDLPSSAEEITFSYKLNFVQTDDKVVTTTKSEVTNNCTKFEKKDTYLVGDEIALCNSKTGVSENFYVIKDSGDTITALAKYNLLVGYNGVLNNNLTSLNDDIVLSLTPISSSEKEYGIQSSSAIGIDFSTEKVVGSILFADPIESNKISSSCTGNGCYNGYWTNSNHGSYPTDVFNSNSNLYSYVKNYENYLKEYYKSVSARLLTYNEMRGLGCVEGSGVEACEAAPAWLYSTSYWTGTAEDNKYVHFMASNGYLGGNFFDKHYGLGIRPVITINKDEI